MGVLACVYRKGGSLSCSFQIFKASMASCCRGQWTSLGDMGPPESGWNLYSLRGSAWLCAAANLQTHVEVQTALPPEVLKSTGPKWVSSGNGSALACETSNVSSHSTLRLNKALNRCMCCSINGRKAANSIQWKLGSSISSPLEPQPGSLPLLAASLTFSSPGFLHGRCEMWLHINRAP